jgi:hypothetical protein
MRQKRSRYIALCQQLLVVGTVGLLGATAAGIHTLEIVPAEPQVNAGQIRSAVNQQKATVDVAPVSPRVEEVAVTGMDDNSSDEDSAETPGAASSGTEDGASQTRSDVSPAVTKEIPSGLRLAAVSQPEDVHGFGTVGVTWQHGVELAEDEVAVQVRTRTGETWSDWQDVEYHDDHGPDADSPSEGGASERPGTDAVVVGDVDQVQMRTMTRNGSTPPDLKLAIIDPGLGETKQESPAVDTAELDTPAVPAAADGQIEEQDSGSVAAGSDDKATLSAMTVAPRPQIYTRAQWGANEKMRDASSLRYGTIQTSFVHHTVNANNYSEADVPALLRGIYAYHTKSRGWSDIGYNFLVDRFGRIWEGRYGGVAKAPVGAHTLGYNEVSFAMSAIGNFDIAQPSQQIVDAFAALFAWKLSLANIRANATGLKVKGKTFQAINGHRDAGSTACPGKYLYAKLPEIRTKATAIQNGSQVTPPMPTVPFTSPTQTPAAAAPQPTLVNPRALSLNGTANASLVTLANNGNIRVYPTLGQVGFRAPLATAKTGAARGGQSAYVGDVNRDGIGDVLTMRNGVARVFKGKKNGTIAKVGKGKTRAFRGSNLLIGAGDWNGDGRPEVIARSGSTLKLYRGLAKFRWSKPILLSNTFSAFTSIAVPGDVTGDGKPDLMGLRSDGALYLFPSVGLQLGTPVLIKKLPGVTAIAGGGDLTGDGHPDLVLRSGQIVQILSGAGASKFGSTLGPFVGFGGIRALSVGKLPGARGTGLTGISGKKYLILPNKGTKNLGAKLPGALKRPNATRVLNVGDWNRDGRGDLITIENNGDSLVFHPGNGNGSFGTSVVMSAGWKTISGLTVVGDVTGDGNPDLVGRTSAGTVIFPGNGATGFTGSRLAPANMTTFNSVGPGLWNAAAWNVLTGGSTGVVPRVGSGAVDNSRYDAIVGSGDLDGDGVADVVARQKGTGVLWLLPGANGGIGTPRFIADGFGGFRSIG